jgi:glycosyltransferase involved in cell wall biosynthesis
VAATEEQSTIRPVGSFLPVSVVVFSKDRPLQLEGLLRSFALNCRDVHQVSVCVLYAVSKPEGQRHYERLCGEYPWARFVNEGDFRANFERQLQEVEYVVFLVDDTLFVRRFAMKDVLQVLAEHPEALGFSLRLGQNTVHCYPFDKPQALPAFETLPGGMLRFSWRGAELDFGYPLEVSSSVYRVKDIVPLLKAIQFKNPNTLESELAQQAGRCEAQPFLICYPHSAAFSIPLNRVQDVNRNRASALPEHRADSLERAFVEGSRLDVDSYTDFLPNACHQEVRLKTVRHEEKRPAVSIVIPCYNQAQFLAEAVQSVAAQTYSNWEMLIVNDGSKDDTSEVANQLAAQHPTRLIRVVEKANGGLADARNTGIRLALGRYILPLDADDKIAPTMLEQTVACLEANTSAAIAYTDAVYFGAVNHTQLTVEYNFARLCFENQMHYCSLYRREVWGAVGGYNGNMTWGYEDWDFWIGCGEKGFFGRRVPEPLFHYRVKPQSMFTAALERDLELRAQMVLNHPSLYNEVTRTWARAIIDKPATPSSPAVPNEILSRAELLTELRKQNARLKAEIQELRTPKRRWQKFWRKCVRRG